jgi:S1-C subfamily serine protease
VSEAGLPRGVALILFWLVVLLASLEPGLSRAQDRPRSSVGTGFVVTPVGHVVTAYHVIRDRTQVLVGPVQGKRWAVAKVLHVDSKRDLALLEARVGREPLSIADWSQVPVGLEATVIGFPQPRLLGLEKKITQGIVNGDAASRSAPPSFQLSAEIHQGNSGGPVLAPDGTVIGVVQRKLNALAVAEKTRDLPQNVNYALRSDELKQFLDDAGFSVTVRAPDLSADPRPFRLYRRVESSILAVIGRDPPPDPGREAAPAPEELRQEPGPERPQSRPAF